MRVLTVAFVLVLAACAGGEPASRDDASTETEAVTADATEVATEAGAGTETEPADVEDLAEPDDAGPGTTINFDEPFTWEDSGVRVEVSGIAFISRGEAIEADPVFEDFLEEETQTLVVLRVHATNGTDGTITFYPDQGTLQVGSEQREAAVLMSEDVGGDFLDGTEKVGSVFWEFRGDKESLQNEREARYVVSGAYAADTGDEVTEQIDLTITW